jgi:hypothetical protein
MKKKMIKMIKYITIISSLVVLLTACSTKEIADPNNPSVGSVLNNATEGQLQTLVYGLEGASKNYVFTASTAFGEFGRDVWYFWATDGRYNQFWLGQGGRVPNSTFWGVANAYDAPYRAIKQGNLLIGSVQNTSAVTTDQKKVYIGFAKTIQGYQFLVPANSQYENGIRVDVSDENKPGPFVSYTEALTAIKKVLDDGYDSLKNTTGALPFKLTSGYRDFNTSPGIAKINRALAARVAIYRKDWQGALDALSVSFFNLNGDLNLGPAHVFTGSPDIFNPFYYVLNAVPSTIVVVHPSLVQDALPGDTRVAKKFYKRAATITNTQGAIALSTDYQDNRWANNTSPVPYIRNEELVLIYAEANTQLGHFDEAVKAIDVIRASAGLDEYTGNKSTDALITEILFQRRYSLWYEPGFHRWVDLRRYNRLDEIPVALDQGTVFKQLETPLNELNWDEYIKNR